ncbi:hypothetical protein [Dyadobacter aurulentus]|uniref:hypothetical protein n=1 Tax=Dyadobacter sp. UC 10 TaxID=2605428 RepID=UPI001788E126|nr:hypothetical protein [Dyadobacter sp. UC 10]
MAVALILAGILLIWYCVKAVRANPEKPDWTRAIVTAAFWPLSLLTKRNNFK